MNALVKKEIRLLLPGFLIGVTLTFANCFFKKNEIGFNVLASVVSIVACSAIAVFIALNSFGAEISSGTFSMLLAQPVSRRRIWRTKTLLLAAALFIGGILWCTILYFRFEVFHHPKVLGHFSDILLGTWLFLLVIYSGALWTVLLLRQMAAAFWFTLLTPGAVLMLITGLWPEKYSAACEPAVIAVMLIYSLTGFWFARRLFLRAQDVAWTGGTIALPEMRGLKWWGERPREPQAAFDIGSSAASPHRTWRPKAALFWKELQLHQSQFIMAGVLVLLHLGVIATRKFGNFQRNSSMEFILEIFWGLWLVMPMLVGAAAVAEERKLGTIAGQLCLPVKRRTQFGVKLRVVLLLSVLFGAVMPLLLEGLRILPDVHYGFDRFMAFVGMEGVVGWQSNMSTVRSFLWYCLGSLNPLLPLLTLLGMATTIGAIAFYASTLARNTLQALAPTVLGIIVFSTLLINAYRPELFINYPLWHGWLIYLIGVPVLVIALVAMSFWNCQRLDTGWNVWRRNTFVFAAALAFVIAATTAIYHRAWEKLTPFEPLHGAARLSLSNPAALREQWNTLSMRLPDGRIWTDDYTLNTSAANPLALVLGDIKLTSLGSSHFLNGSNWMNVVRGIWFQWVGIKNDGTLWVSEKPAQPDRLERSGWKMPKTGNLVQFGGETNWSSLVWHDLSMLLIKNDGTLWRWGTTNWNYKHNKWPGMQSFTPYRLGTESNWAEVFLAGYQVCLRKTDGSIWTPWYAYMGNERQKIELEPGFTVGRSPFLQHGQWRGTTTTRSGLSYRLGVRDDGTFRIMADQRLNNQSHSYEWTEADLQFGKDTNWLGVAGHGEKVVTLKDDGTLWLWNFYHDYRRGWDPERDEREWLNTSPVRLGTHADWIAIASTEGGIISLAADGSLWYWPLESAGYFSDDVNRHFFSNSDSHFEPLLDISRKPQFLGNVFGKPD